MTASSHTDQEYRTLIQASMDSFWKVGPGGRLLDCNEAACAMLGYGREELLSLSLHDVDALEDEAAAAEHIRQVIAQGHDRFETRHRRKDGSSIEVEVSAYCVQGDVAPLLFAFSRDISARKVAQAALQASEARYRAVVEQQTELIARFRPDGTLTFVNEVACRVSGRTSAELVGSNWQSLAHPVDLQRLVQPEDLPAVMASLSKLTPENPVGAIEVRFRADEGQLAWFQFFNRGFFDDEGSLVEIQSVGRDITKRRHAEVALRESEEVTRLFIEYAPAALAMFDRDMRYLAVSDRWKRDYGLGERDLRGLSHYEVFPEIPEHWRDIHRRGLAGEVLRADEDRFERADGRIHWLRWEVRPWYSGPGKVGGIVAISEDITERKEHQAALQQMQFFNQAILDAVSAQVAVLDREGNIVKVNESWRRFALENASASGNLPRKVDLGVNYLDICLQATGSSAEGAQNAARGIRDVIDRRIPKYDQEYPCHSPETQRWFLMTVTPLGQESGGVVISHHDISASRRMAEELRQSEGRLRSILRTAPVGIGVLVDRVFMEVNEAFVLMTGHAVEDLIGRSARMLYPTDDDFEFVGREKYRQIEEAGIGRVETRFITKDGRIIDVALASAPVVPGDLSRGTIFAAQDITATKRAEQERLARDASQRDALVREVHHRIKNHLQGVLGLMHNSMVRQPELAGAMDAIVARVRAIAQVYGLQSNRADAQVRVCDLTQTAVDSVAATKHVVLERHTPDMEAFLIPEEAVPVAIVINELITNAIKHSTRSDADQPIQTSLRIADGTVRITVSNSPACLPPGFDFVNGEGIGTGLELLKVLLPKAGSTLTYWQRGDRVVAELVLDAPVVTCRQSPAPIAPSQGDWAMSANSN